MWDASLVSFVVESLLLAIAGGLAGVWLSRVALAVLPDRLPPSVPFLTAPSLDVRVAAFGIGASVLAALILAAWPIGRLVVIGRAPQSRAARSRTLVFRALVVSQVALTVALVVSAGLLAQSLWSVRAEDPGFVVDRVLVTDVGLPTDHRNPQSVVSAEQRILDAVAARPGVAAVAMAYDHPLEANWSGTYPLIGDTTADRTDASAQAELRIVSPGYFEALGVELLDGRAFASHDGLEASGVAIVNEAFALAAGGRVLGRRFRSDSGRVTWGESLPDTFEIVGIVENERFRGLERPAPPGVYLSTRQFPQQGVALLVRTVDRLIATGADLRSTVRGVEPGADRRPAYAARGHFVRATDRPARDH